MAPRFAALLCMAALILLTHGNLASAAKGVDVVKTESGRVQGTLNADHTVRMFKGVPFAAPPVGELRWKPPQPALSWKGVRDASKFGPPCLQTDVYGDIYFRDAEPSEDCLNLDIWMPAKPATAKLPVLLWYYGGGFVAGSASEARYDGENLAKKGIMVVSPDYRLGIFGFFSHPELTQESEHKASGNYGLLDQVAALHWVVKNIAAFGGNPGNITIAGESAGSFSVSALMASPLSRGLFQKAIGESGAFFPDRVGEGLSARLRSETEKVGVQFAASLGMNSLAQMRAMPGDKLLQAAAEATKEYRFSPNIDGYFLPADVQSIYAGGEQSQVPLLAGWNADEGKMGVLLEPHLPTVQSFAEEAHRRFGGRADEFLKLYPATTDEEAVLSAEALAGDDFIAFSTWKWINMQLETGHSPVYEYHFEQVPAVKPGAKIGQVPASEAGSTHACEIQYVFQTLKSLDVPWTEDDFKVSGVMSSYWANFVKNGNPNGEGLPEWPVYNAQTGFQVIRLSGKDTHAAPEAHRARYEFLDAQAARARESAAGGSLR